MCQFGGICRDFASNLVENLRGTLASLLLSYHLLARHTTTSSFANHLLARLSKSSIGFMDVRESQLLLSWTTKVSSFVAVLLWNVLHYFLTLWFWANNVVQTLESYLITHGYLKKYESLDSSKVRYLAIVVESEEAHQISEVIELLKWLDTVGVKRVCLYDIKGVLKESQETIIAKCNARSWKGVETAGSSLKPNQMTLEFLSSSDGKEAVVKAANMLFMKYKENHEDKPKLSEPLLDEALKLVGCSGPEPDLLLTYGPARCHLGFPAWRLRYTEIVHMGHLKCKKYGSLIKAIYRFTTIRQNYGK